jgi:spore coat protein U-like protein
MSKFKRIAASVVAVGLISALGATAASAATATGTLVVSATVLKSCLIGGGTLAFGNYDPSSSTPASATTTVTLTCTPGTSYNIGMDAGAGTGATVTLRYLSLTTNKLGYKLYQDGGHTTNWGNTVGTDTLAGTTSASSVTNTINIFGEIPVNEAAAVGVYADTVTMTVTY